MSVRARATAFDAYPAPRSLGHAGARVGRDARTAPPAETSPFDRDILEKTPSGRGSPLAPSATQGLDPRSITTSRAFALTLGIESGFRSRIPIHHLLWLQKIHKLRAKMVASTDTELRAAAASLRERAKSGEPLSGLLPETFALVKEATRRTLSTETKTIEHYEEQLLAGMVLFEGGIAEVKTGEGKTIAAALAAVLLALEGKGCHVATTNSYLAERDAAWLRPVYEALGLTVGVTKALDQSREDKRSAYASDITYGNAETFAFDWQEDQLVLREQDQVQRGLESVIVDEADDVLIDAAQMPLILSGGKEEEETFEERKRLIAFADDLVKRLDPAKHLAIDYEQDSKRVVLTEEGTLALERLAAESVGEGGESFSLWASENTKILHRLLQAMHGRFGVDLDREYIGEPDKILLVNGATGHPQPKSRWRHGLMEAVLQKEGKPLEPEQRLVSEITYQNFFRMYRNLSGMTGTARGAKTEFREIYGKKVTEIPTHRPVQRKDLPDLFFPHPAPRLMAAIGDAIESHGRGQPVLISTVSVAESKRVSARLREPLLLFSDVALSSHALFEKAAGFIRGADRLLPSSARGAKTTEAERSACHEAFHRLLVADPEGQKKLAAFLTARGLPAAILLEASSGVAHELLNAETHSNEAEIIAVAGARGAVTVATQMAGRGVDIPIQDDVAALGGLRMIGIGHQTNVRKDDQLRGRSGRQGAPGSAQFYVSLGDPLFSYLPARHVRSLAATFQGDEIRQPSGSLLRLLESAVADAHERSEVNDAAARKMNTDFDSIIQRQRKVIIDARREILREKELKECIESWVHEDANRALTRALLPDNEIPEGWKTKQIDSFVDQHMRAGTEFDPELVERLLDIVDPDGSEAHRDHLPRTVTAIRDALDGAMRKLDERVSRALEANGEAPEELADYSRRLILSTLDRSWVRYQEEIEDRRAGAMLHVHRQTNPLVVFSTESSLAFMDMEASVKRAVIKQYVTQLRSYLAKHEEGIRREDAVLPDVMPMAEIARRIVEDSAKKSANEREKARSKESHHAR